MKIVRGVGAVVIGYLVSQGVNALFVLYWYVGQRSASAALLVPLTVVLFLVVGGGTGYLVARIAGTQFGRAGWSLGALIVFVTIGNIIADVAAEPLWHKTVVLLVMAPAVVVATARFGAETIDTRGEAS